MIHELTIVKKKNDNMKKNVSLRLNLEEIFTSKKFKNMKIKYLFAVLAISSLLFPVQAQEETRHEIAVSYGGVPNSIWLDAFGDVLPAIFGYKYNNDKYVGPIGLEYYYHTSPLVGVGAVAVFATHSDDGFNKDVLKLHRCKTFSTLMPSAKFNWLRKDNWGLYSKVAIGATLAHVSSQGYDESGKKAAELETKNNVLFNFQVSAIGVEAGSRNVRGFAELGVGEQGVILGGVRFKF